MAPGNRIQDNFKDEFPEVPNSPDAPHNGDNMEMIFFMCGMRRSRWFLPNLVTIFDVSLEISPYNLHLSDPST